MTYRAWFEAHAAEHEAIVSKLKQKGLGKQAVIDYFDFDNMVKAEPDFCPLYAAKKKCHDMEKLNCYLCACPHFRFNDDGIRQEDGKTVYSECAVDAKEGRSAVFADSVHQDCSGCTIPHRRKFVDKVFDYDWKTIMSKCRGA